MQTKDYLGLFLFFVSNLIHAQETNSQIKEVKFCSLLDNVGKKIQIECYYSGIEEYWSLSPIRGKCNNLQVEIAFIDQPKWYVPDSLQSFFTNVHNHGYDSLLYFKAIGVPYNDEEGYGHLGSNNTLFLIHEVLSIKTKKK